MEDDDAHIRGLIEKVLFTAPGECVNQPDFGVGLKGFVFMPNTPESIGALESTVQEALDRWLVGSQGSGYQSNQAAVRSISLRYQGVGNLQMM
jgi:hypothetical protein